MPTPVNSILARASKTLRDETNVEWRASELLVHLNEATALIVQLDAKAYLLNTPFLCVGGVRQELPADETALVDVLYNTDVNGTPGRDISAVTMEDLVAARPDWALVPASTIARHYIADVKDAKRFFLFPARPAADPGTSAVRQTTPADVALGDTYPLPDLYNEAAYLCVLYHALTRRDRPPEDRSLGMTFYAMFLQVMGADVEVHKVIQAGRSESDKGRAAIALQGGG